MLTAKRWNWILAIVLLALSCSAAIIRFRLDDTRYEQLDPLAITPATAPPSASSSEKMTRRESLVRVTVVGSDHLPVSGAVLAINSDHFPRGGTTESPATALDGVVELRLRAGAYQITATKGNRRGQATLQAADIVTNCTIELKDSSAAFTGRTIDDSGAPISGVRVRATTLLTDDVTAFETLSDLAGSYVLPVKPGRYEVTSTLDGFARSVELQVAVGIRNIDIKLESEAVISGTVTLGHQGERIANAIVAAFGLGYHKRPFELSATSNADGSFRIRGLPAGQYIVSARKETLVAQSRRVTVSSGGVRATELSLRPGYQVSGRVSRSSLAVANAVVRVSNADVPPSLEPSIATAADGSFRITALFPGTAVLSASDRESGQSVGSHQFVAGEDSRVNLELPELRTVKVRAVRANGDPAPDTTVSTLFGSECRTNEKGECYLALGHGKGAECDGWNPEFGYGSTAVSPSESEAFLTIENSAAVSGKVVWNDGSVAEHVMVQANDMIATTNANGEFRFEGLPPRLVQVRAAEDLRADEMWQPDLPRAGSRSTALVTLAANDHQTVVLQISRARSLVNGTVFWPNNAPAAGVALGAVCTKGMDRDDVDAYVSMLTKNPANVEYSRDDGQFQLRVHCDRAPIAIWAKDGESSSVVVRAATPIAGRVKVVLRTGGGLVGTVDSVASEGLHARLYRKGGLSSHDATVDADGRFAFTGLAPASYTLSLTSTVGRIAEKSSIDIMDSAVVDIGRIALAPGASLHGRVDRLVEYILAESESGVDERVVVVGSDSSFRISGLPGQRIWLRGVGVNGEVRLGPFDAIPGVETEIGVVSFVSAATDR